MPHFVSDSLGYVVSTNLKVMFTTLKVQPALRRLEGRELVRHAMAQKIPRCRARPHYLLARDPFARLESFYRDKFLQDPVIRGPFPYDGWQDCQRLLFPHLGIRPSNSPEEIARTLTETPFERFLEILPEVCRADAHLTPQVDVARLRLRFGLRLRVSFERILHLESEEEIATLGLEPGVRKQSTAGVPFPATWTNGSRRIVTDLYREDFRLLGYEG